MNVKKKMWTYVFSTGVVPALFQNLERLLENTMVRRSQLLPPPPLASQAPAGKGGLLPAPISQPAAPTLSSFPTQAPPPPTAHQSLWPEAYTSSLTSLCLTGSEWGTERRPSRAVTGPHSPARRRRDMANQPRAAPAAPHQHHSWPPPASLRGSSNTPRGRHLLSERATRSGGHSCGECRVPLEMNQNSQCPLQFYASGRWKCTVRVKDKTGAWYKRTIYQRNTHQICNEIITLCPLDWLLSKRQK